VVAAEGLTTRVVRALDVAGVEVNDVTIQRASLDDVFLALTGHASSTGHASTGDASGTSDDSSTDEEKEESEAA
jgi:ABC-2 type transport system ATP-binding protein